MKAAFIITLTLLVSFLAASPAAATWLVYSGSGLRDENGVLLQTGDLIQLIYSPDATLGDPNPLNGMPTGNDVLWQTTAINAAGTGTFSGTYEFSGLGYVYIRFFNSDTLATVTYYGTLGPHTLYDLWGWDLWDSTAVGAYLWTVYPFVVIPEPATWLLLLPAGILGVIIFRKKKKKIFINKT